MTSSLVLSAAAAPARLLFEVRATAPTPGDGDLLAELRDLLREREVVVDPQAVIELRNEVLPLDGQWDPELTLPELIAELDAGVRSYLRGNFKTAGSELDAALTRARRNPALIVGDTTARQWMTQALTTLALARLRLRDRAGALAAMAEQIQSFPEYPVTRAEFGSRGEALYNETRKLVESGARGSLLIDVSDPDARIYVNEFGRGRGGAFTSDMVPGSYRVLIMVGKQSRLYRISVHANEQTRLAVDWSVEVGFALSSQWIGLRATGAHGDVATRSRLLARRLAFNDAIVVGVTPRPRGRLLWGAVYERGTGRELRRGQLVWHRERGAELAWFAGFLASGEHAAELARLGAAADREAAAPLLDARAAAPPSPPWPTWPLAGAGLVAVGAGTYLAISALRADCGAATPCVERSHSATWAIALVGGGLATLGFCTFLYLDARRAASTGRAAIAVFPHRHGGFAALKWRF